VPDDTAAYLLLALDLLVVAAVLTLPLVLLLWVLGPLRRTRTRRPAPDRSIGPEKSSMPRASDGERVLRRCEDCNVGWKGLPGRDKSKTGLRVRRWVRRRARARKKHGAAWSRRQGWSRCPSCLSTNVRTSSRHSTGA